MNSPRVILIEFNELCPTLLDRFMAEGSLPNFKTLYESSSVFVTDAGEDPPNLEPWIQWVTVHSGMSFAEHSVYHLGNGRHLPHKCIGEEISDAGLSVGIFGSMNVNYSKLNGYVIPDPWDKLGQPHPEALIPFHRYVARQVQESSAESAMLRGDIVGFGRFLIGNGLTGRSLAAALKQLSSERLDPGIRWRRAALLDQLQYDVFRKLNLEYGPSFATFFSNSTAHFQHYYWRHMDPGLFSTGVPESDHESLRGAIEFGYRSMDELIGRFLRDYPDSLLMLCTALSQQPWSDTTKVTFRPREFGAFLNFAGLSPKVRARPVMAEQFHLDCPDLETAVQAEHALKALRVGSNPIIHVRRNALGVFAGCRVTDNSFMSATVLNSKNDSLAFNRLFHQVHSMRSGRHHRNGALWIRNRRHRVATQQVDLIDIAPTILAKFGVQVPERMHGKPLAI